MRRLAAVLLMLGLAPMLAGCFAAVAIAVPAATAAGLISERRKVRAATPRPQPARPAPAASASPGNILTLTELPPPSGPSARSQAEYERSQWRAFVAYARERASAIKLEGQAESALLTANAATSLRPERRPCADPTPGVLIDLDLATTAFEQGADLAVQPGLAADLDNLRQAGVVVLWISRAPAEQVGAIGEALTVSGLDPTGKDPLLLVRKSGQTKQELREEAAKDVCIVAVAGDVRGDFDQLFDYLRDPLAALQLDSLIGAGWFEVPPPLAPPVPEMVPEREPAP